MKWQNFDMLYKDFIKTCRTMLNKKAMLRTVMRTVCTLRLFFLSRLIILALSEQLAGSPTAHVRYHNLRLAAPDLKRGVDFFFMICSFCQGIVHSRINKY